VAKVNARDLIAFRAVAEDAVIAEEPLALLDVRGRVFMLREQGADATNSHRKNEAGKSKCRHRHPPFGLGLSYRSGSEETIPAPGRPI
jgi:hypothetical protein